MPERATVLIGSNVFANSIARVYIRRISLHAHARTDANTRELCPPSRIGIVALNRIRLRSKRSIALMIFVPPDIYISLSFSISREDIRERGRSREEKRAVSRVTGGCGKNAAQTLGNAIPAYVAAGEEEEGEEKTGTGDRANTKRSVGPPSWQRAYESPRLCSLHLPRLGRTRGNGRVVQLPGVTCILHPTRAALTR